jgi:predicted porin
MPEATVLASVIRYLKIHRAVAWAQRMNTGAVSMGDSRYMRFGFKGCSDIIGQLYDGRFLAIECKSDKGRLTEEQRNFIERVNRHGGLAGMVRSIDEVDALLQRRQG